MSAEAISEAEFIREYTRELLNRNAAIFAGAGLSIPSGYVDWKTLLRHIIEDLGLDPSKEYNLVALAQYHCNKAAGNRGRLTQTIFDHFATTKAPLQNHNILARLPIRTYWTTNYDKLIETALTDAKKVPDVKYTEKQLAVTKWDRDVVVYKMHGDVDHPADAVICKDDYEHYPIRMAAFVSALRGDLVQKTFLFLGFSFTDPNLDYILSRVRVQYGQDQRPHYCIQKAISKLPGEVDEVFRQRQLMQDYFIRDLKRYGIQTVLVNNYPEIQTLLKKVADRYKRRSIFISGAAEEYGKWSKPDAEAFLHKLGNQVSANNNRVITGFGVGVGSAVINGVLNHLNNVGKTISDEDLVMRPFPQVATGGRHLADQWTEYRKAMIDYAGIAIFVFGNKRDASGKIVLSNGMKEEFDTCLASGVNPFPVGATGSMAAELWKQVWADFPKVFPHTDATFRENFQKLGDASKNPDELLTTIQHLIDQLQRG